MRLRQVLSNLVGNAIKFTERGPRGARGAAGVAAADRLHAAAFPGDATRASASPARSTRTIFEAFSQADGSTTRRFGGTGLGLTISATLVQHDGRTHLGGERAGTRQHLPLHRGVRHLGHRAGDSAAASRCSPSFRCSSSTTTPSTGASCTAQLTRWQTQPTAVDGGARGAHGAGTSRRTGPARIALVLLDANMPDIDGFSVAEQIAARPELAGATIMMLTSAGARRRHRPLPRAGHLRVPHQADRGRRPPRRDLPGARASADRGRSDAAASLDAEGRSRRSTVLLAEDNIVNQRVAVGLLTRRGHRSPSRRTASRRSTRWSASTFDLVLMDVQMPEMGGLEATAAIRQREAIERPAHAHRRDDRARDEGDRERCLAAGMDGYLSKPIDPAMLFAVVEHDGTAPPAAVAPPPAATYWGITAHPISITTPSWRGSKAIRPSSTK